MAQYPTVGFHFRVDFDLPNATTNDVRFQEVSGLTASLGEELLNEGGENRFAHKLPTKATYGDLVLKKGVITEVTQDEQNGLSTSLADSALVEWFNEAIINFRFDPVNVQVSLLNENHEPLITWSFEKAYPKSWSVSGLNAQSSQIVVDEIKLAYQYFRRVL